MMVCYIAVPARIVGMPTDKSAKAARTRGSGRGAKLAGAAVTGLFGAIVCTPPYAIARGGILLLGSSALFPLGVALLVIGLMLEAGATGAVKAIKVSAELLAGRSPQTPGGRAPSGLDGAAGHSSATSMFRLTGLRQAGDVIAGLRAQQRLGGRPGRNRPGCLLRPHQTGLPHPGPETRDQLSSPGSPYNR
jgi:hypothetical protein